MKHHQVLWLAIAVIVALLLIGMVTAHSETTCKRDSFGVVHCTAPEANGTIQRDSFGTTHETWQDNRDNVQHCTSYVDSFHTLHRQCN